jgi:hypothetical protein
MRARAAAHCYRGTESHLAQQVAPGGPRRSRLRRAGLECSLVEQVYTAEQARAAAALRRPGLARGTQPCSTRGGARHSTHALSPPPSALLAHARTRLQRRRERASEVAWGTGGKRSAPRHVCHEAVEAAQPECTTRHLGLATLLAARVYDAVDAAS